MTNTLYDTAFDIGRTEQAPPSLVAPDASGDIAKALIESGNFFDIAFFDNKPEAPAPVTMPDTVKTLVDQFKQADKDARLEQIETLKQQAAAKDPTEQLLYWMQLHSHTAKNSPLHRLAGEQVGIALTGAMQQDAQPGYKPFAILNTILTDDRLQKENSLKGASLVMAARHTVLAIAGHPDDAARHYKMFADATQGVTGTYLKHAGRKAKGGQNKNIVKAHLDRYFRVAEATANSFDRHVPDQQRGASAILDPLLALSEELADKHAIQMNVTPGFFIQNYARDMTKNKLVSTLQTRQHVRNVMQLTRTQKDTRQYLNDFTQALPAASNPEPNMTMRFRFPDAVTSDTPPALYPTKTDHLLADYARDVLAVVVQRPGKINDRIVRKTADLLDHTLQLGGKALQNKANHTDTTQDAIMSAQAIGHVSSVTDNLLDYAKAKAPQNGPLAHGEEPKKSRIVRQLEALQKNASAITQSMRQTFQGLYSPATTAEIFQQAALPIFDTIPTIPNRRTYEAAQKAATAHPKNIFQRWLRL